MKSRLNTSGRHGVRTAGRHGVRRATRAATALVLCSFAVPACGGPARDSTGTDATRQGARPVVVATNSVLQSIVRLVGGDAFDVRSLVPDGKDTHDHEPSASDIAALSDARLVVQVGLDYEHAVEQLIERRRREGTPVFTLTDHVTVDNGDPHVFTDPLTVLEAVPALAEALSAVAGIDRDTAVAASRTVLERAASVATERLAPLTATGGCILVTDHDALEYFARRFGCEVVGVVTPSFSSGAETSAAQVQTIVDSVEKSRGGDREIRALFVEKGSSRAVAEKIREMTGVNVVELAVHSLPSDGTYETYVTELAHTVLKGLTS